jgi:hypothetical protein
MEKTINSHAHTASICPNPQTGKEKIVYHTPPNSSSAKNAAIIADPKNNRSHEEQPLFINR